MSMIAAPITVAIPAIPPRMHGSAPVVAGVPYVSGGSLYDQAVASVEAQTLVPAGGLSVAVDVNREGAAATRQRALDGVQTAWVAFLDDDDLFYPHHLMRLWRLVLENGADYAYSWFDGNDPFPMHRGKQMDPADPHHTTMTVLVRTELAKAIGFANHPDANETWTGEDWRFELGCLAAGAKFIGTGEVTWHYRVHGGPGGNTSGLPTRWAP